LQLGPAEYGSAHRGMGFQACQFLMGWSKTQALLWKK